MGGGVGGRVGVGGVGVRWMDGWVGGGFIDCALTWYI